MFQKNRSFRVLPLLGLLAAAPTVHGVTTILDPFTDGGRTNGADVLDANWFKTAAAPTVSVAPDAVIGSGNALVVAGNVTSGGVVAGFQGIALTENREKIVLSFDFQLTSAGNPQDSAFRYGILNDGGTPRTGDAAGNINDDPGYFVLNDSGAAAGSEQIRFDPGVSGLLGGGDAFVAGTNIGSGARPGIVTGTRQHAVLTIQRTTGASADLRSRIGTVVVNGVDNLGLQTSTFNQIGFTSGSNVATSFNLDNVNVERRINIFDDTFASAGATVGNDANDPNDTAWSSISGGMTLSVAANAAIGSGSALNVVSSGTFRNVLTSFADVDLKVGEKIVASFDATLLTVENNSAGFRFGFYDNASTAVANEGYFVQVGTGTSAGLATLVDPASGGSFLGGSGNQVLVTDGVFNLDESDAHYYEWIITRTGEDSALLELYIDGILRQTVVDAAGAFNRFGAFGFATGGASTDFALDNIVVDYVPLAIVPEPATATMGLIALAGLLARRRRIA